MTLPKKMKRIWRRKRRRGDGKGGAAVRRATVVRKVPRCRLLRCPL